MTAVRRSEGPRPGGTDGERASGKTTKILSRWSGGYRDKYGCTRKGGGGGGRRETGTAEIERAIERSISRHATRATNGNKLRDSLPVQGAPSPGHRTNREGTRASEAGAIPGRRLATRRETPDNAEGAVSKDPPPTPEPSTASRTGQGESTRTTIGSLGRTAGAAWHRPPVSFGRTAGDNRRYWGGDQ